MARLTSEGHSFVWKGKRGKCRFCKLTTEKAKLKGNRGGIQQGYLVKGKWTATSPGCKG